MAKTNLVAETKLLNTFQLNIQKVFGKDDNTIQALTKGFDAISKLSLTAKEAYKSELNGIQVKQAVELIEVRHRRDLKIDELKAETNENKLPLSLKRIEIEKLKKTIEAERKNIEAEIQKSQKHLKVLNSNLMKHEEDIHKINNKETSLVDVLVQKIQLLSKERHGEFKVLQDKVIDLKKKAQINLDKEVTKLWNDANSESYPLLTELVNYIEMSLKSTVKYPLATQYTSVFIKQFKRVLYKYLKYNKAIKELREQLASQTSKVIINALKHEIAVFEKKKINESPIQYISNLDTLKLNTLIKKDMGIII